MQLLKSKKTIDFMGKRRLAILLSTVLLVISLAALITRGLNFGIDFTGGTLIEVGYPQAVELEPIRAALADSDFYGAQVQHFGSSRDVLVRIAPQTDKESAQLSDEVMAALQKQNADVEKRRVEFVGPQVGEDLTEQGALAMIYALLGILIYIMVRFQWRFAPGAVIALIHDVTIIIGFFAVFQYDFDLTVLAAILAVIGYSLNDTIVVFDRIRENFRKMRKGTALEIINSSLNQTISRTLMTSITTLLVLVALFVFGGEVIHDFSLALILGVVVGTYSSIYVASTVTLALGVTKADLMPAKVQRKEGDGSMV
ncbi:MAG: protein translocase subunit SecF [Gammaproteobacteria bacterium]|jgi:preprotein translocase subunit SecF|nr:protein translocase subunit SecF [Gammaproteobacteria bacterium]